ncbi:MAG: multicopper oxidase domain-containing protein [Deltaproteobacteria bacterium]|nr:multicopper oxidase domain-containing protein [Deltaproteobacteria bacterium]
MTIHELPVGQPRIIEVRNLSPSEHPFHTHGMSFEVLSINGQAPAARRVEDTLNLGIRDAVRLLVRPEVPGDWMTHCHILPHAEDGMMTVLRVTP